MMAIVFITDRGIAQQNKFIPEEKWELSYLSFYYLLCLEVILFLAGFFAIPFALLKHYLLSRITRSFDSLHYFEVSFKEKGAKDGLKSEFYNVKSIQSFFIPIFIGVFMLRHPEPLGTDLELRPQILAIIIIPVIQLAYYLFGLGIAKNLTNKNLKNGYLIFSFLAFTVPQAVLWGITRGKEVKGSASSAFLIASIA